MTKIDLVYTWVDDKDLSWLEKKAKYCKDLKTPNKDAIDDCRFFNNDELKYSLRSVEKYAPWVNKIFIVTDNQKPSWINLENEKIKIIDHSEIIPKEKLPLYNACAIENAIPYIKDLSEYFIYANDDMFFWDYTDPSFFFEGEKPIYLLGKKINKFKKYNHLYGTMVYKAYKIACDKLNTDIPYFSHHNIDPYRKSLFLECIETFKDEFENTLNNRFRDFTDMQRIIVTYYSYYKNQAILKKNEFNLLNRIFNKEKIPKSQYYSITSKTINKINSSKANLMCINDCRKTTNENRKQIKKLLEFKFAQKSAFEV